MIHRILPALCLGALSTTSLAQIDVAIVAAASTSSTDCRFTDVQSFLMATGQFATVDVINANATTPSVAQLSAYDSVVTWSNFDYADEVALGDNLADYVDQGGGVVVAVFANSTTTAARVLAGRWTQGYEVILAGTGTTTGSATLGNIVVPGHDILAGVNSFSGGTSSFRPTGTGLEAGSTLVAEWSDGKVLVAVGGIPGRVDVGFYPPSNACSSSFWDSSTDGDILLANALTFAAGDGGIGTPYCTSTANSTGAAAQISASGSASVAANDLVLSAQPVPDQPGIFFYGPNQVQVAFGNGFRCVGGTVGRLDVEMAVGNVLTHALDNTQPPSPPVTITPGSTWNFQAWYRDPAGGGAFFNLSDGLEITFAP